MENQHRLISGYRDLSANEIALINFVKSQCNSTFTLLATERITASTAADSLQVLIDSLYALLEEIRSPQTLATRSYFKPATRSYLTNASFEIEMLRESFDIPAKSSVDFGYKPNLSFALSRVQAASMWLVSSIAQPQNPC